MGLIRAIGDVIGAGTSALSGAYESAVWKEYFTSGDMSGGILMKRAEKVSTDKNRNTKSDDNLISSGSGIDVQDNQCMIIVDNGRIVDFCTEPGRYTYDNSTQPSLLSGNNKGLGAFGKEILNQWAAGGQRFSTQRVYFINMGEIITAPIKWGCGDIAFHHTQQYATGIMELDITLRGNGEATIQIDDPIKFYKNIGAQRVGGDNNGVIRISDAEIMSNVKANIVDNVSTAIETLGTEQAVAYTGIKSKSNRIKEIINNLIEEEWAGLRGFGLASFSVNGSFKPTDEYEEQIRTMQATFTMAQNANMMNYDVQKTFAKGFENAGANGGISGVMGMGMAMGGGGFSSFGNMQGPTPQQQPQFQQGQYQQGQYGQPQQQAQPQRPQPAPEEELPLPAPETPDTWKCGCGTENTGKFCVNCGEKKPEPVVTGEWICECGNRNTGKFCPNCGTKKPEKKVLKCDKCGWVAAEGQITKFCPECGDPVTEADFE